MKVVLRIFIPLCIFSFIAFGISVMFLGTQPITADAAISELTISESTRPANAIKNDSTIAGHAMLTAVWNVSLWYLPRNLFPKYPISFPLFRPNTNFYFTLF